jgi:hypothetical protein
LSVSGANQHLTPDLLEESEEGDPRGEKRFPVLAWKEEEATAVLASPIGAVLKQAIQDLPLPRAELNEFTRALAL